MDAFRRPYFSSRVKLWSEELSARDIQLLQLRWRVNTVFGETNHSMYSIFWRYWDKAVSPSLAKLFIEKRPEYFAQGYEGSFAPSALRRQYPEDADLPPQLCATNPGVAEYFADEALKVYGGESIAGGYGNNALRQLPGKPWFYPIQEDDSGEWCKCERCQNSFASVPKEKRYNYLHFDLVNRIAAAAARRESNIGISTLAYSGTLPYPDPEILQLEPNVAVQMCLGIQSWYHPYIYSRQHQAYKDWVNHEISKRPLFLWIYMLCPAWDARIIYKYKNFFPQLYPWHTATYFKEFTEDGIRGWFGEIDPVFHLLEAYIANKISFDPNIDANAMIDEYFNLYYGKAGEPMRRFYQKIEDITCNIENYPKSTSVRFPTNSFTYGIHTEQVNWHLGTPERIAELQKLVDEAENLAASEVEKKRVQLFIDNIWAQAVEGREKFEAREKVRSVPVPRVTLGYAGECDGDLGKVDFGEAAEAGGWAILDGSKLDQKPELLLASDSTHLYIRYSETGETAFSNQKAGLWHNNVEIFLAGQSDYPYGHLAFSPSGEFKALRHIVVEGVARIEEWPLQPVFENTVDEKGWSFVMALPLKHLLPDRAILPGESILANFMRTRRFKDLDSWAWSPIFAEGYLQGFQRMGKLYIAPLVQKGSLPVNGEFSPGEDGLPRSWVKNNADGTTEVKDGKVKVRGVRKRADIYYQQIYPARRGDRILVKFVASGNGVGHVGAYFYAGRGDGAGTQLKQVEVSEEPSEYSLEIEVQNHRPDRITNGFRPVLAAAPDAQIVYSDLEVTIIPRR